MNLSKAEIPNGEILYRYAKPNLFPVGQDEIPLGVFNDESLSCDWSKHQLNPEDTFHISEGRTVIIEIKICEEIKNPTNPKNKGNIELAWKQEVVHDPLTEIDDPAHGANYSHSLIIGSKKKGVTDVLKSNSKIRSMKPINEFRQL